MRLEDISWPKPFKRYIVATEYYMSGMWFFKESGMLELCRKKKTIKRYAGTMPDAFFSYLKLGWPKNLPKVLKS